MRQGLEKYLSVLVVCRECAAIKSALNFSLPAALKKVRRLSHFLHSDNSARRKDKRFHELGSYAYSGTSDIYYRTVWRPWNSASEFVAVVFDVVKTALLSFQQIFKLQWQTCFQIICEEVSQRFLTQYSWRVSTLGVVLRIVYYSGVKDNVSMWNRRVATSTRHLACAARSTSFSMSRTYLTHLRQ